mmetsp:Transcript_127275/g.179634  ORF Transcript_127275/g.179634 Transcript_127275/m.179634 type:complete len:200 (+) Transcript_127275:116-715(+)
MFLHGGLPSRFRHSSHLRPRLINGLLLVEGTPGTGLGSIAHVFFTLGARFLQHVRQQIMDHIIIRITKHCRRSWFLFVDRILCANRANLHMTPTMTLKLLKGLAGYITVQRLEVGKIVAAIIKRYGCLHQHFSTILGLFLGQKPATIIDVDAARMALTCDDLGTSCTNTFGFVDDLRHVGSQGMTQWKQGKHLPDSGHQ